MNSKQLTQEAAISTTLKISAYKMLFRNKVTYPAASFTKKVRGLLVANIHLALLYCFFQEAFTGIALIYLCLQFLSRVWVNY